MRGVPVSYATNATRSFTALALRLKARLLIHTTTNDEAAHLRELDTIVAALEAAGKPFELERHENAPGGHQFNRIDTKLARESRADVWAFLARALTTN